MHPFNLKSALLAKHAQHVVLIHFPIALFLSGVAFDLAAYWTKRATLAMVAYFNLLTAAASVLPALASGILAWQWQLEGQKPKGVVLLHFILGSASGALIGWVGWVQFRRRRSGKVPFTRHLLPLELITAFVVAATAHVGGFVSGINGPG